MFLSQAHKLDPEDIDIEYNLASVLRDDNRPQEALNLYKKILADSSGYPNIHTRGQRPTH